MTKWYLLYSGKDGPTSINVTHTPHYRARDKYYMIISTGAEKKSENIQYFFMIKTPIN